jgi:hypothetical protein
MSAYISCRGIIREVPYLARPIEVSLHFAHYGNGWDVNVECPYNIGGICCASFQMKVPCPLVGSARSPGVVKTRDVAPTPAIDVNPVIREETVKDRISHICEYCGHKGSIDVMYPGWPHCTGCHCSISLKALMALRYPNV